MALAVEWWDSSRKGYQDKTRIIEKCITKMNKAALIPKIREIMCVPSTEESETSGNGCPNQFSRNGSVRRARSRNKNAKQECPVNGNNNMMNDTGRSLVHQLSFLNSDQTVVKDVPSGSGSGNGLQRNGETSESTDDEETISEQKLNATFGSSLIDAKRRLCTCRESCSPRSKFPRVMAHADK